MDISFGFMWEFSNYHLSYLWLLIPFVFNNIAFLIIAQKDKGRTKYSKFLLISQIFNFGLIFATFFIPTYNADNINLDADLPLLYTLGFVYLTIFFFPYVVTHGIALTLYGMKSRANYGKSLLIGGIMVLIHNISAFLLMFFYGIVYMVGLNIGWAMNQWFIYNFFSGLVIIPLLGYIFFIRYGLENNLKWIVTIGIVGIILTLAIEGYELFSMFNNIPLFFFFFN